MVNSGKTLSIFTKMNEITVHQINRVEHEKKCSWKFQKRVAEPNFLHFGMKRNQLLPVQEKA